jgi:nickel-dependent lactate racemase
MRQPLKLPYGKEALDLCLDTSLFDVNLILPKDTVPLKNPEKSFLQNAKTPLGSTPLRKLVPSKFTSSLSVVIVISDHTRPVPDRFLIPWIAAELGVSDSCISILVGTGTHRAPTNEELFRMLGPKILDRFEIIVHDCKDVENLAEVGYSQCGGACLLHQRYVHADIKIATGFIEPHLFAGFSGGSKAIVPGIAGLETISYFHRARIIADPLTTWGNMDQNPVLQLSRDMASLCPPDCIVNVTMNLKKQVTGFFIGEYITAHDSGCQAVEKQSCTPVQQKYPVVITTNSGYPLDMNFYQTVKGISAASRIAEEGGTIIVASECSNGIPGNSNFEKILSQNLSTDDLLNKILVNDATPQDQWQVQVLLQILQKHKIFLYSTMNKEKVKWVRVNYISDIEKTVNEIRMSFDIDRLPVAVIPYGPLTIPVL